MNNITAIAQQILTEEIDRVLEFYNNHPMYTDENLTDDEREQIDTEIFNQANRIAVLFGYKENRFQ